MENFFYAFHSTFCHSNKTTKSGMGLTVVFDFKEACAPPLLLLTLHARQKEHYYYLNIGPNK